MTDATVDAIDTLRRVVLTVRSDSAGRFDLPFRVDPGSFQIRIRRIGIAPTLTDPLRFDGRDTVEVDLLVDEQPAVLDEVAVRTDVPSALNAQRLQDAYARGWRVVAPERVARHRENSTGLEQLLRAVTLANVSISANCLRSHVTNGCLTVFIDDTYFGQTNFSMINPKDVEFIAVIGPTEATTRYGNRAQYGVLMIYTRRFEGRRR